MYVLLKINRYYSNCLDVRTTKEAFVFYQCPSAKHNQGHTRNVVEQIGFIVAVRERTPWETMGCLSKRVLERTYLVWI